MSDDLNAKIGKEGEKAGEDVLLEPGMYTAELLKVTFKETLPWKSQNGVSTGLEFTFKLLDMGEQKFPYSNNIKALCEWDRSKPIPPKSNLCKYLTAINGTDLPEDINMSSFVGKKCMLEMQNKASTKTGKMYANVKSIKKLRQTATVAQETKTPATATTQEAKTPTTSTNVAPAKPAVSTSKPDDFDF